MKSTATTAVSLTTWETKMKRFLVLALTMTISLSAFGQTFTANTDAYSADTVWSELLFDDGSGNLGLRIRVLDPASAVAANTPTAAYDEGQILSQVMYRETVNEQAAIGMFLLNGGGMLPTGTVDNAALAWDTATATWLEDVNVILDGGNIVAASTTYQFTSDVVTGSSVVFDLVASESLDATDTLFSALDGDSDGMTLDGIGDLDVSGFVTAGTGFTATTGDITSTAGAIISGDATTVGSLVLGDGSTAFAGTFSTATLGADRLYTFPDLAGTVALMGVANVGSFETTTAGTIGGLLTASAALTVTTGDLTVTAGDVNIPAGGQGLALGTVGLAEPIVTLAGATNTGSITTAVLGSDLTWTFPDLAGTVALMGVANVGSFETTTAGTIGGLLTASAALTVTTGDLTVTAGDVNIAAGGLGMTVGTIGQAEPIIDFAGATNTGSLTTAVLGSDRTYTLPDLAGTVALMGVANVGSFETTTAGTFGGLLTASAAVTVTTGNATVTAGNLVMTDGVIIEERDAPATIGTGLATFTVTANIMSLAGDGGGNTITTMTGAVDGQRLTIIFLDGNITITDGGTIFLNTGNFVATADDTLSLVFNGTNWYETGRSVN